MSNQPLIIDLSEEFIALSFRGLAFRSEISTNQFWADASSAIKQIQTELSNKSFDADGLVISLPIVAINHQIVTLPSNVTEKDRLIFLGLEINKNLIGNRFGELKLDVTQRLEGEQPLCDYLIMAPKPDVYADLEALAKALKLELKSVIPSFMLLQAQRRNELRATAWVGAERSEVVIWGKDNPLAVACLPSSGDSVGDINRFIVEYFDHVDNLNLSMVYLYGSKMSDPALGYGLSYPHTIFDNPTEFLLGNLENAPRMINIATKIKLPRPPIPLTPRNITLISSALLVVSLLVVTSLLQANNFRLTRNLQALEAKSRKLERITQEFKKLEKQSHELNAEKEFYLNITKRRTPWNLILDDVAKLTPNELWYERLTANKSKMLILGKARSVDDVSSFSINMNNSSSFIQEALVLGTRESEDDNSNVYAEFQIAAKLKSPTGLFAEDSN